MQTFCYQVDFILLYKSIANVSAKEFSNGIIMASS